MVPERRVLAGQCAAHALSLVGGLLVVVPLALNGSDFKGRCLLYSRGYWSQENGSEAAAGVPPALHPLSRLVVQDWGPPAACQLGSFVGVFTVLFGAMQTWRDLFYLHKGHDDTFFSAFLTLLVSVSLLFLSLVSSVMVTLGFQAWCDIVTDHGNMPISCEEAQSTDLHLDVRTSAFYLQLGAAQFGLWLLSSLWLSLSVLSFLKVSRLCRQQELGRCLAREKELLLERPSRTRVSEVEPGTNPSVFM